MIAAAAITPTIQEALELLESGRAAAANSLLYAFLLALQDAEEQCRTRERASTRGHAQGASEGLQMRVNGN